MSEEKLREILQQLADGEMDTEEAFAELECEIEFSEHYEGE